MSYDSKSDLQKEMLTWRSSSGAHTYGVTVDWQASSVCQISYLALAMRRAPSESSQMFIVQSDCHISPVNCDHNVHLEDVSVQANFARLVVYSPFLGAETHIMEGRCVACRLEARYQFTGHSDFHFS